MKISPSDGGAKVFNGRLGMLLSSGILASILASLAATAFRDPEFNWRTIPVCVTQVRLRHRANLWAGSVCVCACSKPPECREANRRRAVLQTRNFADTRPLLAPLHTTGGRSTYAAERKGPEICRKGSANCATQPPRLPPASLEGADALLRGVRLLRRNDRAFLPASGAHGLFCALRRTSPSSMVNCSILPATS